MLELHSDHGRLRARVHSAVYETCQNGSPLLSGLLSSAPLLSGLLSSAGFALRDLHHGVYDRLVAINVYLEDELRHA